MAVLQENIAIMKPMFHELWAQHAVTANQSNVQLNTIATDAASGILSVTDVPVPWGGMAVALSASLSVSPAGGNLTLTITKNDVATPLKLIIVPGSPKTYFTNWEYGSFNPASPYFKPGDTLGLQITTAAGWTATTADLSAWVWWVGDEVRL